MKISREDLAVGRVLSEDDRFMTIEVAKSGDETFTLEQGDEFVTLLFVKADGKGRVQTWKPWQR